MYIILTGKTPNTIKHFKNKTFESYIEPFCYLNKYITKSLASFEYEMHDFSNKNKIININSDVNKNNSICKYIVLIDKQNNYYEVLKFKKEFIDIETIEIKIVNKEVEEEKYSYFYGRYTEKNTIPVEEKVVITEKNEFIKCTTDRFFKIIKLCDDISESSTSEETISAESLSTSEESSSDISSSEESSNSDIETDNVYDKVIEYTESYVHKLPKTFIDELLEKRKEVLNIKY